MNLFLQIFVANVIISFISFAGVITLASKKLNEKSTAALLVSFAAGVMLATALINILPEALDSLPIKSGLHWFMFGIVGAFFLERFLLWYHHHHEDTHNINPTATLVIVGDGIHNAIDGLAIAATFIANPALGIAATVAIAAHEIPQEIADFSILRHCGMSRNKALLWNFISALTAVVGGVIGYYIFRESLATVGYALGFTAGIFLYVAVADLIPELHHPKTARHWIPQTIFFVLGILLMVVLSSMTPNV